MRHVVVVTTTSSVGLVSVFFVDALNLFYISLLGVQQLAAAIGYASTLLFFSLSIAIGIMIAGSALVARALGAGESEKSRSLSTASFIYMVTAMTLLSVALYPTRDVLLSMMGAKGDTLRVASHFMQIVIPSIPFMGFGMMAGALLRSIGDARRGMYVTLFGAAAAFVFDPIFIFGLDMGVTGAAIATFLSRIVLVIVGLYGIVYVHDMMARPSWQGLKNHAKPFFKIAAPALTTQLATPVGNTYITASIAAFGDSAVAGWAIIGRLIPVAFGAIFSLSGAVGPIMGQNLGAGLMQRVRQTLRDALVFTLIFCIAMWALLAMIRDQIIELFGATGDAASLINLFCVLIAGSFIFNGAMFISNATFNNLGKPLRATAFNWARATIGTIPFVYVGQAWGAEGVLIGWGLGAVLFGTLSAWAALHHINTMPDDSGAKLPPPGHLPPSANSPFTTGKGASTG